MTKTMETPMSSIPARRRALPAAPVLIRVPALSSATVGTIRPRRRRLRREIRVAGCWLLALIPPSVACATWGGSRPGVLLAVPSPTRLALIAEPVAAPERGIMLSLEPAPPATPAEADACPVFLSGQILPLDAAEEATHGGH